MPSLPHFLRRFRQDGRPKPPETPPMSAAPWSLRIAEPVWQELALHINRDDDEEHGGALLCGIAHRPDGPVLLARAFVAALDGIDYVPGTTGFRALTPDFVRRLAKRGRREKWAVLYIHGHGKHARSVAFSSIDLESHDTGYGAILDIVGGLPIGALVITDHAIAGDIWQPDGQRAALAHATILGPNIRTLFPAPPRPAKQSTSKARKAVGDDVGDDRQARLFGIAGRELLAGARIGVVGLGGAGSIAVELLARLGVGHLVLIDPDRVAIHNLPRLIAADRRDAHAWLSSWPWSMLPQPITRWLAEHTRYKTTLAARAARRANPLVNVEQHRVDVSHPDAAQALTTCDWIILAADTATARLVVNKIGHQYLIPFTQVGVKVDVDDTGNVGIVHTATRLVLPHTGCLDCQGLIDHTALALESLPAALRQAADYGTGEAAPAVAALNALAVAPAVSEMMLALTGLSEQTIVAHHRLLARRGKWARVTPRRSADCPSCSTTDGSVLARGRGVPIAGVRLM